MILGKEVSQRVHQYSILKDASIELEKNADGSLKTVNINSGAGNLVSVSGSNIPEHLGFFTVMNGQSISISAENFSKLYAPKTYDIAVLDASGTSTLFSFTTTAGSVELRSAPRTVNGVPNAVANAFVAFDGLDTKIREDLLNKVIDSSLVLKIVDGTIPDHIVTQYINGTLSKTQLEQYLIAPIPVVITGAAA